MVDAVRKSDEKDVAVMNISRTSHEREILDRVYEAQRSSSKDHHIAPIIETFEDEREPSLVFFVMPLLRQFDLPPFEAVSEIVELFKQLLKVGAVTSSLILALRTDQHGIQALVFLHGIGVAHR